MARWTRPVSEIKVQVEQLANDALQQICFEFFDRILQRTPVDTGALRRAWVCGTNESPSGRDFGVTWGESFWVVNPLPYAEVIEFGQYPNPPKKKTGKTRGGFSVQAPQGMVRITIAEMPQIVREVVGS